MVLTSFIALVVLVVAAAFIRAVIARKHHCKQRFHNARLAYTLIMAGAILGYFDACELADRLARKDWPTTQGEITEAKIVGEKAIVPLVTYKFAVHDSACSGSSDLGTPGFGNAAKRLNAAQALIADYPVGRRVQVHYNTRNPAESYLMTAVPWNAYMRYGLWIFILVAGLATQHFFGFRK